MKLHVLVLILSGLFLAGCVATLVFMGARSDGEAPEPMVEEEVVATTSDPSTIPFTDEGRQPSVPANAEGTAPVCDRGVADYTARAEVLSTGEISAFTKESVIQAILKRNTLLKTASAACIRTYFRISLAHDEGEWSELEAMSDERLVATARFMAVMSQEEGESAGAFRTRMLSDDATWVFEGKEMKIGFDEAVNGGTVTTYQTATLIAGSWY